MSSPERDRVRDRRHLHPAAWWLWALSLAAAAVRTTNPLLLLLIIAVAGYVVAARRGDAPWARSYSAFLSLGAAVIVIRLVLVGLTGRRLPGRELFSLPSVELPDWAAGAAVGGPVTLELLAGAFYESLQFTALLACFGAANALASPYRLLRCLPAAVYEAGVAVAVALSFAPQAMVSVGQVRAARRLRGRPTRGVRGVRSLAVPVLEGALQRSIDLAASMDARGYGRRRAVTPGLRRATAACTLGGLLATCVGIYAVLDPTTPRALGLPALGAGSALLAAGLLAGGRRTARTRYRPDRWQGRECLVALSGAVTLAVLVIADRRGLVALDPSTQPLVMPTLPPLPAVGIGVALLPALLAPLPPVANPAPVRRMRTAVAA
ncbi:MAG TPA: energy-coupling factor transporter transmembrane component T [Mycobacteriales bacterium]|nr:energy-coupling factor transporter transmembrane component T [Mycobacteriales bacterium]